MKPGEHTTTTTAPPSRPAPPATSAKARSETTITFKRSLWLSTTQDDGLRERWPFFRDDTPSIYWPEGQSREQFEKGLTWLKSHFGIDPAQVINWWEDTQYIHVDFEDGSEEIFNKVST